MGMHNVKPLKLSDPAFLKRVRDLSADSTRVVLTTHAKMRMRERKITFREVLECLRKGVICEPAHLNQEGDWKATLRHQSGGESVQVAVALERQEDGDFAVIITVMN